MFRKPTALVLLFSLLVFTVSVAAASESGLFSRMIGTDCDDERLAKLDEAADTVSVSETTGSVTVEVSQAYYEGNRIFISYSVDGPAEILDGLELADGSYADIIAGGENGPEYNRVIGWRECIVPEDELADTQTFCLAYRTPDSNEKKLLSFTVKQHAYEQYLQGASQAGDYQAMAILYMGKVDLKGMVRIISPEQAASWIAWQEGTEETGTDVIACWNLYQNGEPVSVDLSGESAVDGTEEVVFAVMFPCVDDLSGLTLVPEYSEAGEEPEEAIALELMNQD